MKCPECDQPLPNGSGVCGNCGIAILSETEEPEALTRTLETPSARLHTGAAFAGRYQIIEELGRGGMGTVYRALDQKLNEEVAIKLIRPEIAFDQDTILRFSHELKMARKVSHRNIGRLFELMEDKGTHYITMEYIPGEDLRRLLKREGPLSPERAVNIAIQICEGLREAHRQGIVHRDLKPGNILIDHAGQVRILDFGIASSAETRGITQRGITVGTPEYMSPEQVDGFETDERSDIYSLGIILFQIMSGRRPFEGNSPFAIGYKHKMEPPPVLHIQDPRIPESVSRFVLKCLHKEKEARFQNVSEALSELFRIKNSLHASESLITDKNPPANKKRSLPAVLQKLGFPWLILIGVVLVILLFVIF